MKRGMSHSLILRGFLLCMVQFYILRMFLVLWWLEIAVVVQFDSFSTRGQDCF